MFPPLFAILNASAPVKAIFGTTPLRVYPFGDARAKGEVGYAEPYAVFQTVSGSPENYLAGRPDTDAFRVQVDVYAGPQSGGLAAARNGAKAIRDAVELVAYVESWNGEFWEPDTKLHRYSFDLAFLTPR